MERIRTIRELQNAIQEHKRRLSSAGQAQVTVGLVPTMGYLHEGHASLLERARRECDIVVLSVFVNPLQFGPNEDFERYPRDEERDAALAERCGTDYAFLPDVREMYPQPIKTTVTVASEITSRLCGAARPGHFDGVCTVVSKLFHIVQPDFAYFGLKDAQQVAVIQQMTSDLSLPVTIVPCPTVREADGLAKSSRNVYLSPEERQQALVLSRALQEARRLLEEYPGDMETVRRQLTDAIRRAPLAQPEYVEIVRYPSLEPITAWPPVEGTPVLVAVAVRFGRTRLIDNVLLETVKERV